MPSNRPKSLSLILLCGALFLGIFNKAQAGDKLQRLIRNAKMIQNTTLLIAPVLPDPFRLAKLKEKGDDEKLNIYLERIKMTNEYMRTAVEDIYEFSKFKFMDKTGEMDTYEEYLTALKEYPDSFVVLSFGNQVQGTYDPPKKIDPYYKNVLGVYKTNGRTDLFLTPGVLHRAHNERHVRTSIHGLQRNLERYRYFGKRRFERNKSKS